MGILLVYDVTDERSFNSMSLFCSSGPGRHQCFICLLSTYCEKSLNGDQLTHVQPDIRTWFSNVEQHATEGVKKILIGNKCDWEEKRVVSTERGQQLADELGIPFLEVSAKSNLNVEKAFYSLASDIKKRISDTQKSEQGAGSGVNVADQGTSGSAMGGKCC